MAVGRSVAVGVAVAGVAAVAVSVAGAVGTKVSIGVTLEVANALSRKYNTSRGWVPPAEAGPAPSRLRKSQRVSVLSAWLAGRLGEDTSQAMLAGMYCKADLVSHTVGEFPGLQGVAGGIYAMEGGMAVLAALGGRFYKPGFCDSTDRSGHL